MTPTLEEMAGRLAALEQEVATLRHRLDSPSLAVDQNLIDEAVARAFAKLGITGEPIGAENVQKMLLECGINPEDNEFSRGIIEMREE